MDDNSPLFIIGTERSGTNLLRLILNMHNDIFVPHPPHIFKNFSPLLQYYGNLAEGTNLDKLIRDVAKSIRLHPYYWEGPIDFNSIKNRVREPSLMAIFFAIYNEGLGKSLKKRFCCKSTFMINHIEEILIFSPKAQFIFMIRDGRDVAVSAKKSIFNHYHPFYTAKLWSKETKIAQDAIASLNKEQIITVKYEELINNTQDELIRLCKFLNINFSSKMMNYHKGNESKVSESLSPSWINTGKPILKNNFNKYKKMLSKKEIKIFETIAGDELLHYGYQLEFLQKKSIFKGNFFLNLNHLYYQLYEYTSLVKIQIIHLYKGKQNLKRYHKFLFLKIIPWIRHG